MKEVPPGCAGRATSNLSSPAEHDTGQERQRNQPRQVLLASLVGTAIEFFDFYIYATAAVLVFPKLFFPPAEPLAATLASLATFGLAFIARPIGSILFGHFGDRVGRKATLVAALLTMGISTVAIGLLPTYDTLGLGAPALLAICRLGQGLGLGGEWGGAVLLAVENAPADKRAWYGMFPQLGAPIGFLLSGATFLALSRGLSEADFVSFGWRLPFLASVVLVFVGLRVRLSITETPLFISSKGHHPRAVEVARHHGHGVAPMVVLFRDHRRPLLLGTLSCLATFVLFYLMTVFTLSWATRVLGYSRDTFLVMQLAGVVVFGACIPVSAIAAQRGRRLTLLATTLAIGVFGLTFAPLFELGPWGALVMLVLGLGLMGLTYAPLGTMLSELFPTSVRYTGSSLAFNLAGIFGASLAPYVATWVAERFGLAAVGYYLSAAAGVTLIGIVLGQETRGVDLAR